MLSKRDKKELKKMKLLYRKRDFKKEPIDSVYAAQLKIGLLKMLLEYHRKLDG